MNNNESNVEFTIFKMWKTFVQCNAFLFHFLFILNISKSKRSIEKKIVYVSIFASIKKKNGWKMLSFPYNYLLELYEQVFDTNDIHFSKGFSFHLAQHIFRDDWVKAFIHQSIVPIGTRHALNIIIELKENLAQKPKAFNLYCHHISE